MPVISTDLRIPIINNNLHVPVLQLSIQRHRKGHVETNLLQSFAFTQCTHKRSLQLMKHPSHVNSCNDDVTSKCNPNKYTSRVRKEEEISHLNIPHDRNRNSCNYEEGTIFIRSCTQGELSSGWRLQHRSNVFTGKVYLIKCTIQYYMLVCDKIFSWFILKYYNLQYIGAFSV